MAYICILGRQPELGLAELESKYGSTSLQPIQSNITLLDSQKTPQFNYLGGTYKAAIFQTELEFTDWHRVISHVQKFLPHVLDNFKDGKITVGISVYGLDVNVRQLNASALSLKKIIKNTGRAARIVPNKALELNSAQVLHNNLTDENGLEILLIKKGNKTIVARTKWIQDIEAYRRRDQERPARDSRVGMLPPKLAQIILNLAIGSVKSYSNSNTADQVTSQSTVLDPFCGTGVLLQEAILMKLNVYGTDSEKRMIEYSEKNLNWLKSRTGLSFLDPTLEVADATNYQWMKKFSLIAAETYLGRPFSSEPDEQTLREVIQDVNTIHKKFLRNLASQTNSGFRLCIAVPAWHVRNRVKRLPALDHLEELGYNRLSFVHAKTQDLIYHRENQIVGRELVVLTRK